MAKACDFEQAAAVAASQHGVITVGQLHIAGLTHPGIRGAVSSGRLERARKGVFVVAGSPDTPERRRLLVCLPLPAPTAISHRAAAVTWGVRLPAPEVELSSVGRCRTTGVTAHLAPDLIHDDVRWIDGVPTTTPARTIVDLGGVCSDEVVADTLETLLMQRTTTLAAVRRSLERVRRSGRPGVAAVDQALRTRALGDRRTESVLESRFAELCLAHGLPVPDYQVTVAVAGHTFRLDFAFRQAKVAIEIDGYGIHGGRDAFQNDRRRDALLAAHGWVVLRFTARDLDQDPAGVVALVVATLAARGVAI